MKILKNKELRERIFLVTLVVYVFSSLITVSMLDDLSLVSKAGKLVRYVTYAVFALVAAWSMLMYQWKQGDPWDLKQGVKNILYYLRNHWILVVMLALTAVVMLVSKNNKPLILVVIIWAGSEVDLKKIITYAFYASMAFMFFTIFACTFGVIVDITAPPRADGQLRYSLGYTYPLEFMTHLLFLVLMYVFIRRDQMKWPEYLAIIAVDVLVYKITDANAGFFLILAVLLGSFLIQKIKLFSNFKIFNQWLFFVIILLCAIVPLIMMVCYSSDNSFLTMVDKVLHNRIRLGHEAFNEYGVTLFGQSIEWVGYGGQQDLAEAMANYNFVDTSYAQLLFNYGIFYWIAVVAGYLYMCKRMISEKNMYGVMIVMVIVVLGVLEPRLIQMELNIFLMMTGGLLVYDFGKFFKKSKKK